MGRTNSSVAAILFASLLYGCEAIPERQFVPVSDFVPINKIQIASRFDRINISLENFGVELTKCVPSLDSNSDNFDKFRKDFPSKNTMGFGHANSSKIFLIRETTAICLRKSTELFPIFAAEAFNETINPLGIPPELSESWNKQIALLIAKKGVAKVAYVFGNSNAFVSTYSVNSTSSIHINYSYSFKKAGTWETDSLDAKFSHPGMTSVSETKRSGIGMKIIL